MAGYYNRYTEFDDGESIEYVPYIKLTPKQSDKFKTYTLRRSRLDKISSEEYGTPYFSSLILMANPEYGGLEQNIPNNALIRIPYPLNDTLNEYKTKVRRYKRLNGE